MLSTLVNQHNQNQREFKKLQEQKRKQAISAADSLIQAINDSLHKGLTVVNLNQREVANKSRILASTLLMFQKTTNKYFRDLKKFTTLLKELGDVEHWVSVMEKDLLEINLELEDCRKMKIF